MSADSDRERKSQEDKQNIESQVKDILQKGLEGKHQNYGAALFTGSLTEADASPVAAKNNDGIDLIPVEGAFPNGFATNMSYASVGTTDTNSYVKKMQTGKRNAGSAGFTDKQTWQSTAAMSQDGLLLPFSTTFVHRNPAGILAELAKPEQEGRPSTVDGRLPPYEFPTDLIDGGDITNGTVTSLTLNPFAQGHSVTKVNRGETPGNIDVRNASGGGGNELPLGEGQTFPKNASRPMSLRGPLVLTGWGYDTEGKPTPNFKKEANQRDATPRSATFGQAIVPGFLDKAKQDKHFLTGHMGTIDRWKTGPVDLRWDRTRKVWVSPGTNKVYLCKATRCILPTSGPDGLNSFNFGVNNVVGGLRQYSNPCPSKACRYDTYFPKSEQYPDIEIYDPEDKQWCGNCQVKDTVNGPRVHCEEPSTGCVPFYDAVIIRSMAHITSGKNVKSDCGDKFKRTQSSDPYSKRMGNPCHGWGSSYDGRLEYLAEKVVGTNKEYQEEAYDILYERILIENPLSQGLMLGDSFLSYDTGRRITLTYTRTDGDGCGKGGNPVTVTESLPVHVILQAEFVGVELVTDAHCEAGEMGACTRKIMAQGMVTSKDCGPDEDLPASTVS